MTTIAANLHEMAGDSRVTFGDGFYNARKIHRIGGSIIGVAGDAGLTTKFLAWFRRECPADEVGMTLDDEHQFSALVLDDKGLWFYSDCTEPDRVRDKFIAIGSGGEFAMAAMVLGKSPRDAVALACLLNPDSGKPIDVEVLGVQGIVKPARRARKIKVTKDTVSAVVNPSIVKEANGTEVSK